METPIGLKIHSKELTNLLLFYLSEIVLGSLYLEFVLFVANEAREWFEVEQASFCLVPSL